MKNMKGRKEVLRAAKEKRQIPPTGNAPGLLWEDPEETDREERVSTALWREELPVFKDLPNRSDTGSPTWPVASSKDGPRALRTMRLTLFPSRGRVYILSH